MPGRWGWELTGRAAEVEPDMLLSPSLLHTATLLPGPLCISCSPPPRQLLQGMFLVPVTNRHPQLPSLGCPLPAPPARAALEEPGSLLTSLGSLSQTLLLLLERSWAFSCCFLVGPAAAEHAGDAAEFLSVFSAGKFTGSEGRAGAGRAAPLSWAGGSPGSRERCRSNPLLPRALP